MLPTLRVLFGHIAACCGSMATAMKHRKGLQQAQFLYMLHCCTRVLEPRFTRTVHDYTTRVYFSTLKSVVLLTVREASSKRDQAQGS